MLVVRVDEGTPAHVAEIATTAREVDRLEIFYQTGKGLPEALEYAFDLSTRVWAGYVDDKLITVWGVALGSVADGVGVPWQLATDDLERVAVPFIRRCWHYRNIMREGYDVLHNNVWAGNHTSIRWLKWMGFKLGEPVPMGPFREMFIPFSWKRGDNV